MDPQTGALWAVAISIVGLAFVLLFRTPKEISTEQSKRLDDLEDEHHALDRRFVAAEARLTAEMRHLSQTIERLIDVMQANGDGHARISGRHPTSLG